MGENLRNPFADRYHPTVVFLKGFLGVYPFSRRKRDPVNGAEEFRNFHSNAEHNFYWSPGEVLRSTEMV